MKEYETVIGLEVHVELATRTKIFCGCSTAFGGEPNTHTCPVCMGMPGTLPVLNRKVVEYAVATGLAFHCEIAGNCRFDRKNYFYPDNPQNFQISQLYQPICRGGFVEIGEKKIRIREIHMEEDAGKLVHEKEADRTYVDFNRAGVPLIEIVSEPDMRNADEVIACLEKLKERITYLGVSDCRMQEGSMRADVNLSVRENGQSDTYGTRTEMKNLNSFTAIRNAIETEKKRQIALLKAGESVIQETRRWDEQKGISFSMRSKEDARDYRYFPEPDLGLVKVDEKWLDEIRSRQPEFRDEKKSRFRRQYDLPDYDIEILTENRAMAELFERTAAICKKPKKVSNWLMGETLRLLKEAGMEAGEIRFSPENLAELIELTEEGQVTMQTAKEIFEVLFAQNVSPKQYASQNGLLTENDEKGLRDAIEEVLSENAGAAEEYRMGKTKVIGFLVGQTVKKTKGAVPPQKISAMLEKCLSPGKEI